jgi:hypothetical protein
LYETASAIGGVQTELMSNVREEVDSRTAGLVNGDDLVRAGFELRGEEAKESSLT